MFATPLLNLFCDDVERLRAFYTAAGFRQTFRFPAEGPAQHVEVAVDGFTLGLSDRRVVRETEGVDPEAPTRSFEFVLWCEDVDLAADALAGLGATVVAGPADHPGPGLRVALLLDPEGHQLKVVQRVHAPAEV